MDSVSRQLDLSPWEWAAHVHHLLAPQVHVNGRMALIVLAIVLWAFSWLLFRAYTVLHTPNDVLVEKLGLDIPPEPELLLEEIAARHVQVSWKPEDSTVSVPEYRIELNGRIVGSTKKNETAAVIANLIPATFYDLRIFSISPGQFLTPSKTLNFRTYKTTSASSQDSSNDNGPVVRPINSRISSVTIGPVPTALPRENANGLTVSRRGTNARSSRGGQDTPIDPKDLEDDQGEDLADLSQQFSEINTEIDRIDCGIAEDDQEFQTQKNEKELQRQQLLQEVRDRDEASNDLKKQVHRAETTSRSLQTERTKKEKQLKDKENRRSKRMHEMTNWENSMNDMATELDLIEKQKELCRRRAESQIQEIRDKIAEEQNEIQQIEEENKEKQLLLKDLQEERKRNSADEETEESREADRRDQERDYQYRQDVANLSHRYNQIWQELKRQQQQHVLARQRYAMLETSRKANAVSFAPIPAMDMDAVRRNNGIPRRAHHTNSQGSNVSSPRVLHAPEPFGSVHQAVTTSSPVAPRIINVANGMLLVDNGSGEQNQDDEESLSEAPMSPRADALLPTDLLGDDSDDDLTPPDEDIPTKPTQTDTQISPFPTFEPESFHVVERERDTSPSPGSPSSPASFASPREDFHDPERRSIRSIHPSIPEDAPVDAPIHKRLTSVSNLFSFNRARGKTSTGSDQPPALGQLKTESQSFPRKVDDFDQPRRRLSYGNNWAFSGGNFLSRPNEDDSDASKPSFTRRAFPNLLNGMSKSSRNYDPFQTMRNNSLDPNGRGGSSSPRPGSTYSFDMVPRMSMEESFGGPWRYDRGPARNSPLVPDWASSYSKSHSRRPSLGIGSQTNLSMNHSISHDDEGEFLEPKRDTRPLMAPIGTRPASSQRPVTPKLNPNAPAFNMFKFGKSKEKTIEKDKDRIRVKEDGTVLTNSPPESRKSKDTHSIAPTTSTMESRESLERTTSSFSIGGTGSLESTPASKPTFMSKITRKASSNKFDSWKTKSTSIFSSRTKPGEATTPTGEVTEDDANATGSTEHLSRSLGLDSNASTPGADDVKKGNRSSLGSWNFMRKKPKTTNVKDKDLISENGELVSESGNTTDHDLHDDDSRPKSAATNKT